tara:strand:+ start:1357 stop:2061 length:705 start_codon:yes stop_codon:yes gene_type:complete
MLEWQNLLLEGKMEWGTTQLSREIVNVLKKMLDVEAIGDEDFTSYAFSADKILDNPIPNLHEIRLFVIAQVTGDYETPEAAVHATYFREEDPEYSSLELYIYFPPDPSLSHLSKLLPALKETLRHELEHADQSTETIAGIGGTPEFHDFGSVKRTYLSDGEVAAWVSGLYKRSKMQRRALTEIIDEALNLAKDRILGAHQEMGTSILDLEVTRFIEELREKWLNYARKRYPKAR